MLCTQSSFPFSLPLGREIGPGNIGEVEAVDFHYITIHVIMTNLGKSYCDTAPSLLAHTRFRRLPQ